MAVKFTNRLRCHTAIYWWGGKVHVGVFPGVGVVLAVETADVSGLLTGNRV